MEVTKIIRLHVACPKFFNAHKYQNSNAEKKEKIFFFFSWQSLQKLFMSSHKLTCTFRYIFLKPVEFCLSKSFRICVFK